MMTVAEMNDEHGGITELVRVNFQGNTQMKYLLSYQVVVDIGTTLAMSFLSRPRRVSWSEVASPRGVGVARGPILQCCV